MMEDVIVSDVAGRAQPPQPFASTAVTKHDDH